MKIQIAAVKWYKYTRFESETGVCCDDIKYPYACMVVRNSIYGGVELPYVCYWLLFIAFNLCSS